VAKGEAKGEARSVLRVLDRREVAMTEADRSRIMECADPEILDLWLDRALDAKSIEEVFAD
jgi:hypothetical protein